MHSLDSFSMGAPQALSCVRNFVSIACSVLSRPKKSHSNTASSSISLHMRGGSSVASCGASIGCPDLSRCVKWVASQSSPSVHGVTADKQLACGHCRFQPRLFWAAPVKASAPTVVRLAQHSIRAQLRPDLLAFCSSRIGTKPDRKTYLSFRPSASILRLIPIGNDLMNRCRYQGRPNDALNRM